MPFSLTRRRALLVAGAVALLVVGVAVAVVTRHGADDDPGGGSGGRKSVGTLTGYWQDYADRDSANLRLRDVPAQYGVVVVAFAVADPQRRGAIQFAVDPSLTDELDGYTDDDLIADVATLHSRGARVLLSVGGASDDVQIRDAASEASFADSAAALLKRFGFDGIDIDLEHGIEPDSLATGLRALASRVGPGFALTLAPQTIDLQPAGDYLALIKDLRDLITSVHPQFYNSGSMTGCDGKLYEPETLDFVTAQACTLLRILRPGQVALGFPASPAAAESGYVPPKTVNAALDCLARAVHCGHFRPAKPAPGIGAMTWSINADAKAGYAFARAVSP